VRLFTERSAVGIRRVARVGTVVVGIRPLRGVGFADGSVERVVGVGIAGTVTRVLAGRLGVTGRGLFL
jgi:hypothetical protein